MIKKVLLFIISYYTAGCWSNPAIKSSYNFKNVENITIDTINDHNKTSGSGLIIQRNIAHSFLKYGFDVKEDENGILIVNVGNGNQTLELSCIITDFTDSELIVVPFRYEDKGYTKTTIDQSADANANKKNANSSASSTTTTHAGTINQGKRIEYTRSRVGIMFEILDQNSGNLVWSNAYWYSGLDLQQTTDTCVDNAIKQVKKLF